MEDFKGVEKKSKLMEQERNMNTIPFPAKQFVLLLVRRSGYRLVSRFGLAVRR